MPKSMTSWNLESSVWNFIGDDDIIALNNPIKSQEDLLEKIRTLKPTIEWYGVVVCIREVKQDSNGHDIVFTTAYDIPNETDNFYKRMFDLSLTHKIVSIGWNRPYIYVMESDDGQTNIDIDVMEALKEVLSKPIKTLYDELREWSGSAWSSYGEYTLAP